MNIFNPFGNTSTLLLERLVRLLVGLFLLAVIGRQLGPEKFGEIAFALAITTILARFGSLGLSPLVTKYIAQSETKDHSEILTNVFSMRLVGGTLSLLLSYIAAMYITPFQSKSIILILAIAQFVTVLDIFEYALHGIRKFRLILFATLLAGFLSISLSLFLYISPSVITATLVRASWMIFFSTFIAIQYLKLVEKNILFRYLSIQKIKQFSKDATPLALGIAVSQIYLRSDQLMIGWMTGDSYDLAQYAVAAQFAEAWYILPMAIANAAYPSIAKKFVKYPESIDSQFRILFKKLTVISLLAIALGSILGEHIVVLFFGNEYKQSATILSIYIWAGYFVSMRAGLNKRLLIEEKIWLITSFHATGAVINVILNFILIQLLGYTGAAYATVISYAISGVFLFLIFPDTRSWLKGLNVFSRN